MDELLPKFLSFPPHPPPAYPLSDEKYDAAIRDQIEVIKKMSDSKLLQSTSGGEHALEVINPALNTVPYAFLLLANMAGVKKNKKSEVIKNLFDKTEIFLLTFDARQIRYLGGEFTSILEGFHALAVAKNEPWTAVPGIAQALLRVNPSGSMFTQTHLSLVKLALEYRAFQYVIPLIEKDILYFPGTKDQPKAKFLCDMSLSPSAYMALETKFSPKLKYQDLLEYFYYSGLVFIGAKQWEAALQCLENAVTFPAKDGVSKIMSESYKKWVLVGILVAGKLLPLPRSTSSAPAKVYHTLGKPHETLAQIFENGTASRLKAEAEAGNPNFWGPECNTGLVLEVLSAYQRNQIRNLANVYTKVSIQEVIKETTSAETGSKLTSVAAGEALIRDMIRRGELHATLEQSASGQLILSFLPGGKITSELEVKVELAAATNRIKALTSEIKNTDRLLTHDKDYIKATQKQRKSGANDTHAHDFQDIEDEDIMGMY